MGKLHQLHTAVTASYGVFLGGILYVWPSYTASLYTETNTTLLSAPMTHVDISLIGSLPSLGAMLGTILAGKIINVLGRQKGGLILTLPFLLSWFMISHTKSSIVVMIARFVGGISCGGYLVYGPIFISEVAEESIRGALASGPVVFHCIGVLTSYMFGWILAYHYILYANLGLCCIALVLVMTVTESPIWLMRQKRETDARLAYAHYRGLSPDSKTVLEGVLRLKAQVTPAIEFTSISDGYTKVDEAETRIMKTDEEIVEKENKVSSFKMIFNIPSIRRAFIVTGLTLSLQIMMGFIVVQVYAVDIFSNAIPSISPHLCSVMLAATLLFGTLTSAAFSDKFGRRVLLIISASTVALCLICMGLLLQTNILPSWVTVVVILVYCYAFKFGSGSVPYILLAEVFIPEVQSTAAMLLVEWVCLFCFIQLGIFPFIIKYFGLHVAFYCFAVFGILDALVAIFLLPETKGLTNEQIQEAFSRKRKS